MTEISVPQSVAEVKATHFSPEGKVIYNPSKEQLKPAQPEKKGLFDFLKRQREEILPQQPEGPKHVLEALQEMNAVERHAKSFDKLRNSIDELENAGITDLYSSSWVHLDAVRAVQDDAPTVHLDQTPPEIQKILNLLNQSGSQDRISDFKIRKNTVLLRSSKGIGLSLQFPSQETGINVPDNHLSLRVLSGDSDPTSQKEAYKSIEDSYSNKENLLAITKDMVSYTERVADVLPTAIKKRMDQEQEQKYKDKQKNRDDFEKRKQEWQALGNEIDKPKEVPKEKPIVLSEKQEQKLAELRAKYPDHPLCSTDLIEVPSNYRSVYCVVTEERFARMAQDGLKPQTEYLNNNVPVRAAVDKIFDKAAPEGYSRTDSVYAYPTMDVLKNKGGLGLTEKEGNIIVEIKVDPDKVLVAEMEKVTDVIADYEESRITDSWLEDAYWERSERLSDYLRRDHSEKNSFYDKTFPEVIIPGGVRPEMMRAVSVIVQDTK